MLVALRIAQAVRHPRGVFYGWWMAVSGTGMVAYTDGVGFYGFTAFFAAILKEFRWSQAVAAVAPALQSLGFGILAPVTGYLIDRLGPRRVLLLGFFSSGAAFMLLSRIQNLWQYYGAFVILALGLSAGSFLVASAAVSNWFARYRALAISIVILGPGLSGILAGALVWLIPSFGWRTVMLGAGLGFWLVCIPLALVMRDRPERYGLRPDGADTSGTPQGAERGDRATADIVYPIGVVLRSRGYWQYVLSGAFSGASGAIIIFFAPALESYGMSPTLSGTLLLWLTVSSIPARLLSGLLADLFDKRLVLAGSILLQLVGALAFAATTTPAMAFLATFLLGSSIGSSTPPRLALQAEYWGRSVFGRLAGIQMGLSSAPGILAPVFVGWMFDTTESYRLAFVLLALPLVVTIPLVLTIRRPQAPARPTHL